MRAEQLYTVTLWTAAALRGGGGARGWFVINSYNDDNTPASIIKAANSMLSSYINLCLQFTNLSWETKLTGRFLLRLDYATIEELQLSC